MIEADIQKDIVLYLKLYQAKNNFLFFSVPNERTNQKRTNYFKSIGMLSGVADLVIVHGSTVFFMEVKLPCGTLRKTQKEFQVTCDLVGCEYEVVRSLDEARIQLDKWEIIKI